MERARVSLVKGQGEVTGKSKTIKVFIYSILQ
jgi:hypothetical protein